MSVVYELTQAGSLNPPKFMIDNTHYETMVGSVAYGVSGDTSDIDVYGFCIPPKEVIFPHLAGEIKGFGRQCDRFEEYREQHVRHPKDGREYVYDLTIYSIVKYFQLGLENNPNLIDSLFTPADCVLHITKIGRLVRDNRHIFLHKGVWHTYKGYAYSQLCKMGSRRRTGKRAEIVEKYGYDVKFAYHVVRLLKEVEQILVEGDLDLRKNREELQSIRRGEWTEREIREYFSAREKMLEKAYAESELPPYPEEARVKDLLLSCLEEHYGDLGKCVVQPDAPMQALKEIKAILDKFQI